MESKVNHQSELAKSIRVHALLTREMGNIYLHQFNDLPSHQIDDMFDVEPDFPSTFNKKQIHFADVLFFPLVFHHFMLVDVFWMTDRILGANGLAIPWEKT